jgi:hypothetical protein
LSETLKFSTHDIKSWLESETESIFTPVHANAQKLTDEMHNALENLADVNKTLLDNSEKEIQKRNMKTYGRARALSKLSRLFSDRIKQITVPEKVSYDSFNAFIQDTQKAFGVIEVDIKNWFPRISPFFILDRRRFLAVFEKAKILLKEMQGFQTKEYVKTKTLEETFKLIGKLNALESQLVGLNERKAKVEHEKSTIEHEIAETQQKMVNLKDKGGISQLDQINVETKALNREVKHNLRHLQKPFIKLQSLTLRGKGSGLTPEESQKLNQYLENPFEALAREDNDYPLLRQILQKLDRLLAEGKLKLKSDKKRKAEQAMQRVINENSLDNIHKKCADVLARRRQISTSPELAETKSDLSKLEEHVENLERRKNGVETEESLIERESNDASEKIRNHKSQIENNVFSFMGKRIHIE